MNQLVSYSYKCCQQGLNLRTESKRFRQRSQQLQLASKIKCQQSERLRAKSNNLLQQARQLEFTIEKRIALIERKLSDSNECLSIKNQMSIDDLDRQIQMIDELQFDVNQRLQKFKDLQLNVDKYFQQISQLIEQPHLNNSASVSQNTVSAREKVVEGIERLIAKINTGDWLE